MDEPAARTRAAVQGLVAVMMAGSRYRTAAADHFGLDLVGTHAVSYLATYGPMPQAQLARLMGLTSGGVTGVVDRLERVGAARRANDPNDRRRNRVELTERAATVIADSRVGLARVFDGFEPEAVTVLAEALPTLAARLRD